MHHRYAATGEVQARIGLAGAADIDAAVRAARAAQPGMGRPHPPLKRAGVLFKLGRSARATTKVEAAELGALDNGSPISRSQNPGRVCRRLDPLLRRAGATSSTGERSMFGRADAVLRPARGRTAWWR